MRIVVGAAVALVLLVVLVVVYWNSGDPLARQPAMPEQAEQLAKQAATDADPAARKAAAGKLAEMALRPQDSSSSGSTGAAASSLEPGVATSSNNPADVSTVHLRQLIKGNGDAEVRAAAAQGLGWAMDWESVPELLKLCDDPSPLVRGRAGAALQLILGADYHFRANDDSQTRKNAIQGMKQVYQQAKGPPRRAP